MKTATNILLALAIISVGLFLAGLYMNRMDVEFGTFHRHSAFSAPFSHEGMGFFAFGLLGLLISMVGCIIIGIIHLLRRHASRA